MITRGEKIKQTKLFFRTNITVNRVLRELFGRQVSEGDREALCIFHDDKNPSMKISKDMTMCNCLSCRHGGDSYSIVMYGNKSGMLLGLKSRGAILSDDALLAAVSEKLNVKLPFLNFKDEFESASFEEQAIEMINNRKTAKIKISDVRNLETVKMRFSKLAKQYRLGKIDLDTLLDTYATIQHESISNPKTLDEIMTSIRYVGENEHVNNADSFEDFLGGLDAK